jgi:hypothetical protein
MNTTQVGNDFTAYVLELLRTKYKDASTEGLVSWKKADIVFSMMNLGRRVRIAVECKCYSRKLKTSDLSKIHGDYQAAFDKQEISTLIIVSKYDVEAASKKFLDDTPRLRFLTVSQLEEWLIGLRPYIEGLARIFKDDDVSHYYIDSRVTGFNMPAFDVLRDWVYSQDGNGIAILGGYGLGKSSLAKRLAADQAQRYLDNPENERMPILLRLGQVVHETELGGLFGKEFTAEHVVEGYSFSTLMHLNSSGRLLIILDGFDEMKHAMTEHDFRSNFREFNKLRNSKSKILLLGRPNALTSESASLLISGIGIMGGQSYLDSDFPAWRELNLEFFSPTEGEEFLLKYLSFANIRNKNFLDEVEINSRVKEVVGDIHPDILQRPVQARIVGQLAANPKYSFKNSNRFKLYNDFVERMIGRDQEKRARRIIPPESRRAFLEDLAWWAWTRVDTAQGVFRKDEVPQAIFDILPNGEAVNNTAKRSEYLVSSLTEHKNSDVLYFAHRSFQEFLVASYISKKNKIDQQFLVDANGAVSQDVYSFLKEVDKEDYIVRLYEAIDPRAAQEIGLNLIALMQRSKAIVYEIRNRKPSQLTHYDVAIIAMDFPGSRFAFDTRIDWLLNTMRLAQMSAAECALYILLVGVRKDPGLVPLVLAAVFERVTSGMDSENTISAQTFVVDEQHFGGLGMFVRDMCKKIKSLRERRIYVSFNDAMAFLNKRLASSGIRFDLDSPFEAEYPKVYVVEAIESELSDKAKKIFRKFYALRGESFDLVAKIVKNPRSRSL